MLKKNQYILIIALLAAIILVGGIAWAYHLNNFGAPKNNLTGIKSTPSVSQNPAGTATTLPSQSPVIKPALGSSSKLPILMYHAIDDNVWGLKGLFVSTSNFESQMKYLYENGYTSLSFDQIESFDNYAKPVIITFDDGYEDVYTYAYPVLKKYNLKATVFLISSAIGSSRFLKPAEINEMSDLVSFQSHTVNHVELDKQSSQNLINECSLSKQAIEKLTGKTVIALCYPSGKYNDNVKRVTSEYYLYGITTQSGFYDYASDKFAIKRLRITNVSLQSFAALIKTNGSAVKSNSKAIKATLTPTQTNKAPSEIPSPAAIPTASASKSLAAEATMAPSNIRN